MINIELIKPSLKQYYYEAKLQSDPLTMSYNAGYDVSYFGYHYDTGCIDFSKEKFIEFASGCDGHDCYKMYYINKNIDINDIKIQEDELTMVKWFSLDILNKMVDNKELNENQISCFIKVNNFLKNS